MKTVVIGLLIPFLGTALGSELTGYKVDIKNETQAKDTPGFRYEDYLDDEEEEYYYEDGEYAEGEYAEGEYAEGVEAGEDVTAPETAADGEA